MNFNNILAGPNFWIATLEDPDGNDFQLTTPYDPSMIGGDNAA